jgi:hypothetical protein
MISYSKARFPWYVSYYEIISSDTLNNRNFIGRGYYEANWELDELIEHFTILPNEMKLVENKTGETRIGFAVLLKFFQMKPVFQPINMKSRKWLLRTSQNRSTLNLNYMPTMIGPGVRLLTTERNPGFFRVPGSNDRGYRKCLNGYANKYFMMIMNWSM